MLKGEDRSSGHSGVNMTRERGRETERESNNSGNVTFSHLVWLFLGQTEEEMEIKAGRDRKQEAGSVKRRQKG